MTDGTPQKKSCQKTYGRFSSFWEICHNRAVNIEKVQRETVLAAVAGSRIVAAASRRYSNPVQRRDASATLSGLDPALIRPQSNLAPAWIRPQSGLIPG